MNPHDRAPGRNLSPTGRLRDGALKRKDASDPDSFKVRKGEVGGYRETLSEDDRAFIEDTLNTYPCSLVSPELSAGLRAAQPTKA
jgi:hypothetical protein